MDIGTNYLAGTDPDRILSIANEILEGGEEQESPMSNVQSPKGKGRIPPLWDGKAAERIVEIILREIETACE